MTGPEEAAENLRVIRNLMERATVYRAISAPTALFAAAVAIPTGLSLALGPAGEGVTPLAFWMVWAGVYLAVDLFNGVLLWRDARRRGAPLLTANLRHAFAALVPPMLAGGLISLLVVHHSYLMAALCWVLFYGLGLLATHGFAPASIKALGGVFVIAGLAVSVYWRMVGLEDSPQLGAWLMAGTFGLFHLVYGISIGLTTRFRLDHGAS